VLALVFAASLLVYTTLWFVVVSPEPKVQLGYDATYLPLEHAQLITAIYKDSPAEKTGLRPGDRIVALDGQPLTDESFQNRVWLMHQPGDQIRLTIARPGTQSLLLLTATFRQTPSSASGSSAGNCQTGFPRPSC
jgi:S1-C subfamily serine protease